jgi:magnesium-transporting ATPase (P-type)
MGYTFLGKNDSEIITIIDNSGNHLHYTLLHVIDFDSNRKRMSVIVKDPHNNIKLICKGADEVIESRLSPSQPIRLQ